MHYNHSLGPQAVDPDEPLVRPPLEEVTPVDLPKTVKPVMTLGGDNSPIHGQSRPPR